MSLKFFCQSNSTILRGLFFFFFFFFLEKGEREIFFEWLIVDPFDDDNQEAENHCLKGYENVERILLNKHYALRCVSSSLRSELLLLLLLLWLVGVEPPVLFSLDTRRGHRQPTNTDHQRAHSG